MGFQMKRYNNLFEQIVSLDNLYLAEKKARKNKTHRPEVIEFDKNIENVNRRYICNISVLCL